MKASCCIVIPIYKFFNALNSSEIISICRGLKVLAQYEVFFACPKSLPAEEYLSLKQVPEQALSIISFEDHYFTEDRSGYNRLLKSLEFYERFSRFDFLLLMQTDSYVFRDELAYWMGMDYDYIGGPMIYEEFQTKEDFETKAFVGNGGFSLRKIDTYIKLLKANDVFRTSSYLWQQFRSRYKSKPIKLLIKLPWILLMQFGFRNRIRYVAEKYNIHEDYFWCDLVAKNCKGFSIAPPLEAVRFSLDGFPQLCFDKILNKKLPMGCHAWMRFDPEFWKAQMWNSPDIK